MSNQEPRPTRSNRALVPAAVAAIALALAASTLIKGGHPETKTTKVEQSPLANVLSNGAHRSIQDVELNPAISGLENVAKHPFAQTTAQTAVEISKKEAWKNATIVVSRDSDGSLGAFLVKATPTEPVTATRQEAIALSEDSVTAVTIDGKAPESIDALLLDPQIAGSDNDNYTQLAQEFLSAPKGLPVID